jgi:hypothetical protein
MAYNVTISETVNDVVVESPGYPITINYNASVVQQEANIAALEAEIDAVAANVTILQGNVVTLIANAATQAGLIANNAANITTLQGNIVALTANAATQANLIANNAANITTLQGNVVSLEGNAATQANLIANNAANITTLQGNIVTLTANAATQAGLIANNAANITTLQGNVVSLEGNAATQAGLIANNAANITTLQGNIVTLTANAATQAGLIANNAANITTLQGNIVTLTANAATQAGLIANNAANITTLQGNIVTLTANAATQAGLIANNAANITTLQGNVVSLEGNAATQAGLIANNAANITTLQGNVVALAANLANTDSTVSNLTTRVTNIEANVANASGTITTGNIALGNATATGNVTANYFLGNGSQLTGIISSYGNANVANYLPTFSGNLNPGNVTATGNVTAGNVRSSHFDAVSSAGGALRNTAGATQLSWGGGGGNNISVAVAINLNPANAQVAIEPTGTGHVDIRPANYANILPGNTGSMNRMVIGNLVPAAATFTTATVQGNLAVGNISATGNITGDYILGNGSQLTGLPEGYGNADVAAYLPTYTGNIGAGNVAVAQTITVGTGSTPGRIDVSDVGEVRFYDNNNSMYVGLHGPGDGSASYDIYLPNGQGAANTVPVNDGAGNLTWTAVYGNADVAAYLPTYTGNLSPGNLTVSGITALTGNVFVSGNINGDTNYATGGLGAASPSGRVLVGNTQVNQDTGFPALYSGLITAGYTANVEGAQAATGLYSGVSVVDYGAAQGSSHGGLQRNRLQNFVGLIHGAGANLWFGPGNTSRNGFQRLPIISFNNITLGYKQEGQYATGNITIPTISGTLVRLSAAAGNGFETIANTMIASGTFISTINQGTGTPRINSAIAYAAAGSMSGAGTMENFYGFSMFKTSPEGSGWNAFPGTTPTNYYYLYNDDERANSNINGTVIMGNATANTQVTINQGTITATGNLQIGNAIAFSGNVAVSATDTTISHKIPVVINGVTYYIALTAAQ